MDREADVGAFFLHQDGRACDHQDLNPAAFVAAATPAIAVAQLDADGGDGMGEFLEGAADALLHQGSLSAGERNPAGLGHDVHENLRSKVPGHCWRGFSISP